MSACDNYVLVHAVAPQPLFSRGTESVHSKGGLWEALWCTSEGFFHPSTRSTLKEQPWKALSSTFVRPAGNSIDVNEEQSLKAYPPMLMSPAGRAIDVIEEQPSKALSPMVVRPAGNSIDVNEEQPTKVYSSMLVSPAGSAIDVIEEQPSKAPSPMVPFRVLARTPFNSSVLRPTFFLRSGLRAHARPSGPAAAAGSRRVRCVFAFPTGEARHRARRFDAAGVSNAGNAAPTGTVAKGSVGALQGDVGASASEQNRGRRRWRDCLHAPRPAISCPCAARPAIVASPELCV
eukprot:jgi/Chrpa1/22196/Chrysochromulina_OHIO_Genome00022426-RA